MDVSCVAGGIESNTGATTEIPASTGVAVMGYVGTVASISKDVFEILKGAAGIVPTPSIAVLLDEDEDDGYNSAELVTDAIYSPESKLGMWPLMRVGTSSGVTNLVGVSGNANEYTWLGTGLNAIFMNTGGANKMVGGVISLDALSSNIPSVSSNAYVASGLCVGSGLTYSGGNLRPLPTVNVGNFTYPKIYATPYEALLPKSVSAAERTEQVAEVKSLLKLVKAECLRCAITVGIEAVVSGVWPAETDPDFGNLPANPPANKQAVVQNFIGAATASDDLLTALTTGPDAVTASLIEQSAKYYRVSRLPVLLKRLDIGEHQAAYTDWHSALRLTVNVSYTPVEDRGSTY